MLGFCVMNETSAGSSSHDQSLCIELAAPSRRRFVDPGVSRVVHQRDISALKLKCHLEHTAIRPGEADSKLRKLSVLGVFRRGVDFYFSSFIFFLTTNGSAAPCTRNSPLRTLTANSRARYLSHRRSALAERRFDIPGPRARALLHQGRRHIMPVHPRLALHARDVPGGAHCPE